jgi:hypothetical protein
MAQFHSHWYLTTLESPPIYPPFLVLEPQKEVAGVAELKERRTNRLQTRNSKPVHRTPYAENAPRFEVTLLEGRDRRRFCGRSRNRGSTQETISGRSFKTTADPKRVIQESLSEQVREVGPGAEVAVNGLEEVKGMAVLSQ